MKRARNILCLTAAFVMAVCLSAAAETASESEEQGVEEIRQMLGISNVEETEGMSLEEMTDAFADSAMSEYVDHTAGFSMQYPSVFQFDEETGNTAVTADGRASLTIENIGNAGGLTAESLLDAIRLEIPDYNPEGKTRNNCIRADRKVRDGTMIQTDLYHLTEKSFHHIILRYPSDEEEIYSSYIEYMINTMETNDTDLG